MNPIWVSSGGNWKMLEPQQLILLLALLFGSGAFSLLGLCASYHLFVLIMSDLQDLGPHLSTLPGARVFKHTFPNVEI